MRLFFDFPNPGFMFSTNVTLPMTIVCRAGRGLYSRVKKGGFVRTMTCTPSRVGKTAHQNAGKQWRYT
jgi:hypothetical protein